MIVKLKSELSKTKTRYISDEPINARDTREYRMISSERWKSIIGVSNFDKKAEFVNKDFTPSKVEISLKSHIGAPSVSIVKVGDKVSLGEKIAEAGSGLSLPKYASIDGVCTYADDAKIIIERVMN